jgi:hypothetical protein
MKKSAIIQWIAVTIMIIIALLGDYIFENIFNF